MMKIRELSPFLNSQLYQYIYDECFNAKPSKLSQKCLLQSANSWNAANSQGIQSYFVDDVDNDVMDVMNLAKSKFMNKFKIKDLEWDTKN